MFLRDWVAICKQTNLFISPWSVHHNTTTISLLSHAQEHINFTVVRAQQHLTAWEQDTMFLRDWVAICKQTNLFISPWSVHHNTTTISLLSHAQEQINFTVVRAQQHLKITLLPAQEHLRTLIQSFSCFSSSTTKCPVLTHPTQQSCPHHTLSCHVIKCAVGDVQIRAEFPDNAPAQCA
jgi:hypothetical protein